MLQYIDCLARDLSINTRRKSNPIMEMFASYRPSDYRGLIDEYIAAQQKSTLPQTSHHVQNSAGVSSLSSSLTVKVFKSRMFSFLFFFMIVVIFISIL